MCESIINASFILRHETLFSHSVYIHIKKLNKKVKKRGKKYPNKSKFYLGNLQVALILKWFHLLKSDHGVLTIRL